MAEARRPGPVRFFTAVLAADERCLQAAARLVAERWGEPDLASPHYPFAHTGYYAAETGTHIIRAFFSFPGGFDREELPARKNASNAMEKELAAALADTGLSRPVNLDPGYLALEKIVLASCKNFAHRLYLGQGVFGEVTLFYRGGRFEGAPWTFPDFLSGAYDAFFLEVRRALARELGKGHG